MTKLSFQQQDLIDKVIKAGDFSVKLQSLLQQTESNLKEIKSVEEAVDRVIAEKTQGFPWLSDAIAQYFELRDLKVAEFLEKKLRPGISSAERVKELARDKRDVQKKFLIARNLIKYYEALFPWLPEYVGEDIDDLIVQAFQQTDQDEIDPVHTYLTKGEYENLSPSERNQKALDRYWLKKKTSWQVGRDYERYIGYLYEMKGYSVYYQGIEKGLEDLGRDLVCKKRNEVVIVQCKYWREERTVHEKHINQLFGTTVEYFIKHNDGRGKRQLDFFPTMLKEGQISAAFVTSASLSETAKNFAGILGVKVEEHFPFKQYPSIKCNVSHRDGTKIYHLPLDQQYDRTTVEEERNECYVLTVAEAERLGFRRAWRWGGKDE